MPQGGTSQAKRFAFTLNNYTEDELTSLRTTLQSLHANEPNTISYAIFGREIAASGTPHLQGYVEFGRRTRLGAAKQILGNPRIHMEIAIAQADQNIEYCSKEDENPFIVGHRTQRQGRRNDLLEVQSAIRSGSTLKTISDQYFATFVKYHRGIERSIALLAEPRTHRTQVVYLYGPTGTGKTRYAFKEGMDLSGGSLCFLPDHTLQWFDGYETNIKVVIIDDFDGTAKLSFLLRLFDRYYLRVPVKGGFKEWNPRIVYITSNYPLDYWYKTDGEHYNALLRRIDEIHYMTKDAHEIRYPRLEFESTN